MAGFMRLRFLLTAVARDISRVVPVVQNVIPASRGPQLFHNYAGQHPDADADLAEAASRGYVSRVLLRPGGAGGTSTSKIRFFGSG